MVWDEKESVTNRFCKIDSIYLVVGIKDVTLFFASDFRCHILCTSRMFIKTSKLLGSLYYYYNYNFGKHIYKVD